MLDLLPLLRRRDFCSAASSPNRSNHPSIAHPVILSLCALTLLLRFGSSGFPKSRSASRKSDMTDANESLKFTAICVQREPTGSASLDED